MLRLPTLCFIAIAIGAVCGSNYQRVRLEDVQTLTFYGGKMTTARRSSPIPQMKCISGPCHAARIPAAQCYNKGSSGHGNVQWRCDAEMPSNIRFGTISVSCEGYDYSGDEYVLDGSCGLEYTLLGGGGSANEHHHQPSNRRSFFDEEDDVESSSGNRGFPWLFAGVLCVTMYFIWCHNRGPTNQATAAAGRHGNNDDDGGGGNPRRGTSGGYHGGGGFFGGGGSNNYPPPGSGGMGGTQFRNTGNTTTQTMHEERQPPPPQQRQGGGWMNFWTGLAGGALLANLFGPRHHGGVFQPGHGFGVPHRAPRYSGGGGGFGGGFGGGGGMHRSSGFGGTSSR